MPCLSEWFRWRQAAPAWMVGLESTAVRPRAKSVSNTVPLCSHCAQTHTYRQANNQYELNTWYINDKECYSRRQLYLSHCVYTACLHTKEISVEEANSMAKECICAAVVSPTLGLLTESDGLARQWMMPQAASSLTISCKKLTSLHFCPKTNLGKQY